MKNVTKASLFNKMHTKTKGGLIIAAFLATATPLLAADFKGAAQVLKEADEKSPTPKATKEDPDAGLREKLKTFESQSSSLSATDAAKQWLQLVDEFVKRSNPDAQRSFDAHRHAKTKPVQFADIFSVLPPPSTWTELEKAVEARPIGNQQDEKKVSLGLRLIAHTLTRNTASRAEDLKEMQKLAKTSDADNSGFEFRWIFASVNKAILATMEDPQAILQMLESQLSQSTDDFGMPLEVPNLVAIVGPEKAEGFFRKAFKTHSSLQVQPGTATHRLATKVAIEAVGTMPIPHWELVNSLDCVELYEALNGKFGVTNNTPADADDNGVFLGVKGSRRATDTTPKLYYFLGLIAKGRAEDAIQIAKSIQQNNRMYFPPELIKEMERAGLTRQLDGFFAKLLKESPESPFWGEYVKVAAHAGHANEALNLLRITLEKKELIQSRRTELRALLPQALLANDDIEAGINELRNVLTNHTASRVQEEFSVSEYGMPAIQMAQIGKLLNRPEWIEEGLAAAMKQLSEDTGARSRWLDPSLTLAALLMELGRGPEAEGVLLKSLRQNRNAQTEVGQMRYYGNGSMSANTLKQLVQLYHNAGRYDDVIYLLDNADDWGAEDLADIGGGASDLQSYGHHMTTPVSFYAAAAFAKTGKTQQATTILNELLKQHPGLDRLYELLIELEPEKGLAKLDELYALDQFEERPLIWKASLLLKQKKLEEAEATARKAISIDPSDGEEGPGDRMRAYAVLADIREARGDKKEAEFFRGAVAAIRESETADRYHEAGLLKRAVQLYEDSLKHFADAYCIQSRLAIQLADLGLHEEAEAHYRKAYELMPESFGRVESHCFGCERAFEGERAQSIAEKVFTQLAQKTPDKPQVHYLLGYLRSEQERPGEALTHFQQAVKLDPDYLNAWEKINEISTKTVVPAAERDAVVFNMLRLDPRQRHVHFDFETVSDLAGLWKRVSEIPPASTSQPKFYTLAASKAKLAAAATKSNPTDISFNEMSDYVSFGIGVREEKLTPARAVMSNGFITAGRSLLGSNN